ncbi:MAG TPA: hypothetical protein VK112_02480 [Fodinibius sp.]|nr:hypothetical protein [Fodinibius sp.]
MLQTFYNSLGFIGSISIAFFIFISFIFWMAGVAGISQLKHDDFKQTKLFFAVIFPPYPIFWVLWDIYAESQFMKEEDIT